MGFEASLLTAESMIVTRCVTADAARRSVDSEVSLAIVASFGLGAAL
jgi:hypothetical protein